MPGHLRQPLNQLRQPNEGVLQLGLRRYGDRTVLHHCYAHTPLRVLRPVYLDDSGAAYLYILNPCGGVLGGDTYCIDMILEADAHAYVTTPSATKLYAAPEQPARQHIQVTLHDRAIFAYLPEQTIPFANSAFHQQMTVRLGDGAHAFIGEILAPGRLARDEAFAYRAYIASLRVEHMNGEVLLLDRTQLRPQTQDVSQLGLLEAYPYLGTFYALCGNMALDPTLADAIHHRLNGCSRLLGSASTLPHGGLAVRLLASDHSRMSQAMHDIWNFLREQLLGYPAVPRRT